MIGISKSLEFALESLYYLCTNSGFPNVETISPPVTNAKRSIPMKKKLHQNLSTKKKTNI